MRLVHWGRFAVAQERGAVAVLLAVLLTAVLVPLSGYGVQSYVKSGLTGELQRAADAGALAGAATIPLTDPGSLQTYLAAHPGPLDAAALTDLTASVLPTGTCTGPDGDQGSLCPLAIAKTVCEQALTADQDGFGSRYADASTISCTAEWAPDAGPIAAVQSCIGNLTGDLVDLTDVTDSGLLPVVPDLLDAILTNTVYKQAVAGLGTLLPALLRPQIKVTATFSAHGPLDALTGESGDHPYVRAATARRAFKNVVVLPRAGVNATISYLLGVLGYKQPPQVPYDTTIDLNPAVGAVTSTVLSTVQSNTAAALGTLGCQNVVPALSSDLSDLIDPPTSGAPTADQILTEAATYGEPVLALNVPANLTDPLQIPFLDFVPICVGHSSSTGSIDLTDAVTLDPTDPTQPASGSGIDFAGCALSAPGIFKGRLTS